MHFFAPSPARRFRPGNLLLEAVVAIALFAIFIGGIGLTLLVGERTTVIGGDRSTGAFIAEQQLEGLRAMARSSFQQLTPGTHGVWVSRTSGVWEFSGASLKTSNGYMAQVNIVPIDSATLPDCALTDCLQVTATASWNFGQTRSGSVVLRTYLTNWHKTVNLGNWANMQLVNGGHTSGPANAQFRAVAVAGNYAYIAGNSTVLGFNLTPSRSIASRFERWFRSLIPSAEAVYTGNGLYIYDISNPANPVRVSATFTLGTEAYSLAIHGNRLYVVTGDSAQELKIIDITNPLAPAIAGGFNLPTAALGRSVAYVQNTVSYTDLPPSMRSHMLARLVPLAHAQTGGSNGDTVFIGTTDSKLYGILVNDDNSSSQLGMLDLTSNGGGQLTDIALHDGFAYVAMKSNGTAKAFVVDVFDPRTMHLAPNQGVNPDGAASGNAIVTTATGMILGRMLGATQPEYEVSVYDINSAPVPTQPAVGAFDIAGNVNKIALTLDGSYAFVASNASVSQIRVVKTKLMASGAASVVYIYNAGKTIAWVYYDPRTNKVFAVAGADGGATSDLYIFAPG